MLQKIIHRPIAVSMIVIALTVLGIISAKFIPISLMPEIDIPRITALRADERRDKLRKASGRSKYPLIRRSLNGETWLRKPQSA